MSTTTVPVTTVSSSPCETGNLADPLSVGLLFYQNTLTFTYLYDKIRLGPEELLSGVPREFFEILDWKECAR